MKEILPYYRRNLKVAVPVMLTQLGAALVGLFDTIMVGHYSTVDLAAVSLSNSIFWTVMIFSMGVHMAITPLVGIQVGRMQEYPQEGQVIQRKISKLFHNGLVMSLIVGLLSTLLLALVIPFFNMLGQEADVVETALPYYKLIILSMIPFLLFCLQKQFLEGLGNTTIAMVLTLIMNGLNILLNWIFIYGKCGFEPMGATGAGLATLISRIALPITMLFLLRVKKSYNGYLKHISFTGISIRNIMEILKVGIPIGVQSVIEGAIFTLSFIFIGWIDKETLAAHQVANQVANLTFMLAVGIGSATTIRVSHQLGRGDKHAVRMACKASIHLVILMNTIGALSMLLFRHQIPLLFSGDSQVCTIASSLIVAAGMLQYADGLQVVGVSMLRGITDVKIPVIIAFFAYIVVGLTVGLLLAFPLKMGAMGIWIGFIVGLTLAAILFHWRFNRKFKQL